ncbi:MAG: TlpA family protein disulfide reductase [Gammaproteobacteria bacterium]|nr:TlpA family protein disulfide reductase [Gammaproteobacteria bacterium]
MKIKLGNSESIKWANLVCSFFLSSFITFPTFADYAKTEPSDGTVNSFIKISPPQQIEQVEFLDPEQQHIIFDQFKGKVVLINLWATCCRPCVRELPALDCLAEKIARCRF